jgi:hypothetical protein
MISNSVSNDSNSSNKPKSNKKIFRNYVSIPLVITLMCITSWIFGKGDIELIRYWYFFSMCCLLFIRISEFVEINYHHFLIEMCYFINILTMFVVLFNIDIRIVYPFTHGPLLFYCVMFGDAPIPERLSRTITFTIHAYSALVSRKIFWSQFSEFTEYLTFNNFILEFIRAYKIYLIWFVLYSIYLFRYNGKSETMIKYMFKLNRSEQPDIKIKILWIITHMFCIMLTCSFGILVRYNYWLNVFVVSLMLISAIYQTGRFYYKHNN